jgi:ATP-dependent exoDNAse (exonuclease V) alpha subunit
MTEDPYRLARDIRGVGFRTADVMAMKMGMTREAPQRARNLVYTAVTRGKRLVVIVGQRRAMAIAVRGGGARKRWTKLREWLAAR